jgi:hypothetical protein
MYIGIYIGMYIGMYISTIAATPDVASELGILFCGHALHMVELRSITISFYSCRFFMVSPGISPGSGLGASSLEHFAHPTSPDSSTDTKNVCNICGKM